MRSLGSGSAWACAALLGLVLLSGGCSVKLIYNNADRFIRWEVADFVDFDPQQRAYFDGELALLLYWHRQTQLPLYADLFASMPERAAMGITTEQFAQLAATAEGWGAAIQERMLPVATQMLLSMSSEQVEELPSRLAKANAEFLEDERDKTLEEDRKRWGKAVEKGYRRFIGRLTGEQRQYLRTMSQGYVSERELWVDYRKRWQSQLLAKLESWDAREVSAQEFADVMAQLSANRAEYYGEFEAVTLENRRLAAEVSGWLLSNLTPKQQDKFGDVMEDLAQDLRELAADLPKRQPAPMPCLVPVTACGSAPLASTP